MTVEPDAIRIRPAGEDDALGIATAHTSAWQTAYRGILPDSFLDALEPESRVDRWREVLRPPMEGRFTFVAETEAGDPASAQRIVGFASAGPERDGVVVDDITYDGEIYALYLVQEYRRRGIGHRLVGAATDWLLNRGVVSVIIWALEDNRPARAFYEKLGGAVIGKKTVTVGPSNLIDVAYGWPDARSLLRAAEGRTG